MTRPAAILPDGRRLHLQHGPIDLVIEAFGDPLEVRAAYAQAEARFSTILDELVAELPRLRSACPAEGLALRGPVARRMEAAVAPHAPVFITPMAAVAGAVADEILAALLAGRRLRRAYVNNGGDIALFLAPGEVFDIGIVADPRRPALAGTARVAAGEGIAGVATSGRHGRSFSLGIAAAVTVLAATGAAADAAATMIANRVDLPGSPKIRRVPARELAPDSDLGDIPVTVEVAPLTAAEADAALDAGASHAAALVAAGRIAGAALMLDGRARLLGHASAARLLAPRAA